jgi:hypothetical protein
LNAKIEVAKKSLSEQGTALTAQSKVLKGLHTRIDDLETFKDVSDKSLAKLLDANTVISQSILNSSPENLKKIADTLNEFGP